MAVWRCQICGRLFVKEAPHETLGVDKDAPLAEIKKTYRAIVKETHPDAAGNDEEVERFHAATEAYQALKAERGTGRRKPTDKRAHVFVYQSGRPCPGCGRK